MTHTLFPPPPSLSLLLLFLSLQESTTSPSDSDPSVSDSIEVTKATKTSYCPEKEILFEKEPNNKGSNGSVFISKRRKQKKLSENPSSTSKRRSCTPSLHVSRVSNLWSWYILLHNHIWCWYLLLHNHILYYNTYNALCYILYCVILVLSKLSNHHIYLICW